MKEQDPWLSIVVAARNDNYGGDFNLRLMNSLNWIHAWNNLLNIPFEIIIVNYNPIPENPTIKSVVSSLEIRKNIKIRIIDVPQEIHLKNIQPEVRKTVPLFEFLAKNIGIRRARGQFILCTNADILPDPGIFLRLGMKKLSKKNYYRADRLDFSHNVVFDFQNPLKTLLEIRKKVFKMFLKGYSYSNIPLDSSP